MNDSPCYRGKVPAFVAAVFLTSVGLTLGQEFAIESWSIDSGGGSSNGGRFSVVGTIGQPDAGRHSGGPYTIDGGFWQPVQVIQVAGAPQLHIDSEASMIVLSWNDPDGTAVLEESIDLRSASWQASSLTIQMDGAARRTSPFAPGTSRFFRLKVN